ncbi:MAG: BrnT family toxin [Planctomycetes bacterium]|nr:BrnT family toxin [Planctomycetota bacterium]
MEPYFSWDHDKARRNLQKHGVGFEEAATVFPDPLARITLDPEHSERDTRELILGESCAGRLIVVSFVERGEAVRIISARLATRTERHEYEEG